MICIAAFLVLGILGIFSIKYRALTKEAFHCVFLRVQFRPCETGFDLKMKSRITAKLIRFPRIARIWRKHFQVISLIFTLLLGASFYFSTKTVYNIVRYGTCTPGKPCILTSFPARLLTPFHISPEDAEVLKVHKIEIYFFYERSCPNYRHINDFFKQRIKQNYPVIINQYEVNKSSNLGLAKKLAKAYDTKLKFPIFFVGNIYIKGCDRVALRKLEEAVRSTIRARAPSPLSRLEVARASLNSD